ALRVVLLRARAGAPDRATARPGVAGLAANQVMTELPDRYVGGFPLGTACSSHLSGNFAASGAPSRRVKAHTGGDETFTIHGAASPAHQSLQTTAAASAARAVCDRRSGQPRQVRPR